MYAADLYCGFSVEDTPCTTFTLLLCPNAVQSLNQLEGGFAVKFNYATLAFAAIALIFFETRFLTPPWTALRIAALLVAVLSFVLLAVARIQLGSAFSVQAKAETLVITGLYARIRNPIYIFSSLLLAGLVVFDGVPWLLLGVLALVPVQWYRSRNEAKVLAEKFGPAYIAYRQQTWF